MRNSLPEQFKRVRAELEQLQSMLTNSTPDLPPRYVTSEWIQGMLRARRRRDGIFGAGLFADPGWDMLLALFASKLSKERATITDLAKMADVPNTTALRWVGELVNAGLAERAPDPKDKRRVFIELSTCGVSAMEKFFGDPEGSRSRGT